MSEDIIKINIDDSELDMTLAKLQQAMSGSSQIFETPNIILGAKKGKIDLETTTGLLERVKEMDLPTVNREMRVIIGQIPQARQALSIWFRIRRLQIGLRAGDLQLWLTVIATAIIVLKALAERQRKIEQRQQEYENYIRRERGLTHDQYNELMKTWQSYFRSKPG